MSLPIDVRSGIPTGIQDYDGFDTPTVDDNRWETTETGSTAITQEAGELVFRNTGGVAGVSYLKSMRRVGKLWRMSADMWIDSMTGTKAEAYISIYKDANNYIKVGPYKDAALDCNCLLRYKIAGETEHVVQLTGDTVDATYQSTYTIVAINDTIIFYYKGYKITSMPFGAMVNYYLILAAGTTYTGDAILAKINDFEIINSFDTLQMTIGKNVRDIRNIVDNLSVEPTVTDISGTLVLDDATEHFLTFATATYGQKFKLNLFADLEGADINYCYLYKETGAVWTNQSNEANTLQSNSILLKPATGGAINDCIYFGNDVNFSRLDVYMDGGTSNTNNVYAWEGYVAGSWQALTETDGTFNTQVFGKSGKVTWTETLAQTTVNGILAYWVRARITTLGASLPKASHVQVTEAGSTGFDSQADFMNSLVVRIFRKRGDGSYAALPVDIALPFTQCILYRNVEISDLPAWTDIKIGFKLSAAPISNVSISYTGYAETIVS